MKKRAFVYLLLLFPFCIAVSCDDNLRTMSLRDFIQSTFDVNIDKKHDSIIMEERNFPGFENRGEGMAVIKLRSPETIKSLEKIAWLKSKRDTFNLKKHTFKDVKKDHPVVFDQNNQVVEIWYDEDWRNVLVLKSYLKSIDLKNVFYSAEYNRTKYGFTERKVMLYDKDSNVLFLILDNRRK